MCNTFCVCKINNDYWQDCQRGTEQNVVKLCAKFLITSLPCKLFSVICKLSFSDSIICFNHFKIFKLSSFHNCFILVTHEVQDLFTLINEADKKHQDTWSKRCRFQLCFILLYFDWGFWWLLCYETFKQSSRCHNWKEKMGKMYM